MLQFSSGLHNKKLRCLAKHLNIKYSHIVSFDLPAGYTCPAAYICKTYANRLTGHVIDNKYSIVRCYASSQEVQYSKLRVLRWNNYDTLRELKDSQSIADNLLKSLPKNVKIVRIHTSGDFFNYDYFKAWCKVAESKPKIIFYGYTKMLYTILADKPDNLHLIYSHGSIYDAIADRKNIPQVYIVRSLENPPAPVICNKLNNDFLDFEYILNQQSFSILIHGTQKAKNEKSKR